MYEKIEKISIPTSGCFNLKNPIFVPEVPESRDKSALVLSV
jgi:hypothetical protein